MVYRHRQGLGSQASAYAQAGPGPSTLAQRHAPSPSRARSGPSRSTHPDPAAEDESSPEPDLPVHLHVPPEGHGPPALRPLPPVFVRETGEYDAEGRLRGSLWEGSGRAGKRERMGGTIWSEVGWEEWQEAEEAAASGGADSRIPDKPSSAPRQSFGTDSSPTVPATAPISGTSPRSRVSSSTAPPPAASPNKSLLVPRSQWFIRKALLKRAAAGQNTGAGEPSTSTSASSGSSTPATSRAGTPSLASLIDLPPPPGSRAARPPGRGAPLQTAEGANPSAEHGGIAFRPPTWYAIPRSNVGYQMMVRGGWEGGGLGKPVGAGAGGVASDGYADRLSSGRASAAGLKVEGTDGSTADVKSAQTRESAATGATADTPIELSDSDDGSDSDVVATLPFGRLGDDILSLSTQTASGPGRTAPIATVLKRAPTGIGYLPRRSGANGHAPQRSAVKRVTHTEADLRALKRGKVVAGPGDAVERGRKRVVRDAKREGRERQWIRSVLEA